MNKRIILLDLNFTLVGNSIEKRRQRGSYADKIELETYRQWLVDLLRDRYVILVTIRPSYHKAQTLARIQALTGWQPQEALFCWKGSIKPEVWKGYALEHCIFPKHGADPSRYLAIESNANTHKMYAAHGVQWVKAQEGVEWDALPGEAPPAPMFEQGGLWGP
jgi:hypothetical protein